MKLVGEAISEHIPLQSVDEKDIITIGIVPAGIIDNWAEDKIKEVPEVRMHPCFKIYFNVIFEHFHYHYLHCAIHTCIQTDIHT